MAARSAAAAPAGCAAIAERMRSRIRSRASGIAGFLLVFRADFPPFSEGLFGEGAKVPYAGPVAEHAGEVAEPVSSFAIMPGERTLPEAGETLHSFESCTACEDGGGRFHGEGFEVERALLFADDAAAEVDEDFGDVDFDGADFVAGSTEGGRIGEGLRVLHVEELRGDDGADGAGVTGSVGVAAGLAVDGAGVEAGGAADAVQRRARFRVGQDAGATVVEENDVKMLWAVVRMNAGPERVVGVHALAGGGAGQ